MWPATIFSAVLFCALFKPRFKRKEAKICLFPLTQPLQESDSVFVCLNLLALTAFVSFPGIMYIRTPADMQCHSKSQLTKTRDVSCSKFSCKSMVNHLQGMLQLLQAFFSCALDLPTNTLLRAADQAAWGPQHNMPNCAQVQVQFTANFAVKHQLEAAAHLQAMPSNTSPASKPCSLRELC